MKPTKEEVFELVNKTKQAATEYQNLRAQRAPSAIELERAAKLASDYNTQLKAMLALFTEEERNEMRKEFNK